MLISFVLGIEYDTKKEMIVKLLKKVNDLKMKNTLIEKQLEEFDQFFNSFDHATLYIYDLKNDRTYYSKGVESLFGYTQNQFNNNGRLWTTLVHEKDQKKLQKSDELLFSGNKIEVDFRVIHPIDGEKWIKKVSKPVTNKDGKMIKINGQFIDITKQKELEIQLRHMAYFDDLTDLPNRKMLDRHIKKGLARSKRHNHNFTLMFIDLDDFKQVNDNLGHDAGDMLLKEVTSRLNTSTREEDMIARIGGDEFIVVFEETSQEEIENIAKRIINNVSASFIIDGHEVFVSVSIGISMYPEHGEDKETLIQNQIKRCIMRKIMVKTTIMFLRMNCMK